MNDRATMRTVVWFTGVAVLLFGSLTVWLASRVLDQSSGKATVDAAAVAVVAIPAGFTTTALGFLGGMLVSTRTTPNKSEIDEALAPLAQLPPTMELQPAPPAPAPTEGGGGTPP